MEVLNFDTVYQLPNGLHYRAVLMLCPVPGPPVPEDEAPPEYVVADSGHILLAHIEPPVYGKLDEDGNPITGTYFDCRTHEPIASIDALCEVQASTAWTLDDLIPVDPDDPPT